MENESRLEEMLAEERGSLSRSSLPSSRVKSPKSGSDSFSSRLRESQIERKESLNKQKARELMAASYHKTAQETKRNVEKAMKHNKEKKQKKFLHLSKDIDDCLDFLDAVDKNLSLHEEAELNKVKRQFGEWNTTVHGKIQDNISSKLNSKDYKTMLKEKNDDYQKFLDITNKKSAIFRDIIIESEYDPLEPNRRAIKANTGKLRDPTLHVLQKTIDEMEMLDPEYKSGEKGGRYTLPIGMWASGQIEATPHGRFGKMMASANNEEKRKRAPKSKIVFDEYNFARGKEVTDAEMPRGKKPQVSTGLSTFTRVMHGDESS